MTLSRPEVLRLLERYSVVPSRALGQNFVVDPNTVRRVARLSGAAPGKRVVEVGAGLGSLTLALLEAGAAVTAVERDHRLAGVLEAVLAEKAPGAPVAVLQADAMGLEWQALLGPGGAAEGARSLAANLPYNVATPLIATLLDEVPAIEEMTVMVQQEVAERLSARPGEPGYGAVSVKVAYWAEAKVLGAVPSSVFLPRPRVGSAIVSLTRRPKPVVEPSLATPEEIFSLARAGFAQRRKMLRRSLSGVGVGLRAFGEAGVAPEARAEELSVSDWGRLAAALRHERSGRSLLVEAPLP
jgi:16S rRNA (adenine1518-N6/adenine1519-N6)-dimethyltransferase